MCALPSSTPNASAPNLAQIDPPSRLHGLRWPIVIGVIVSTIAMVTWYTRMGTLAQVATGSVVQLTTYSMHTVADPSMPGPGMPGATPDQNQVIVLAQIQVKNISKEPLDIFDLTAQLTLPQEQRSSLDANPENIQRLFDNVPSLASMKKPLLERNLLVAPGQTAKGLVVFNYPIPEQQWKQRRNFQITVSFYNAPSLIIHANPAQIK